MREETSDGLILGGVGLAIVALIALLVWAAVVEGRTWDKFRIEHHCRVVARERGSTSVGVGSVIGSNGSVSPVITTSTEADKTSWLCDDGITYTR